MKKFMIFTAALVMSLCFASCKQQSEPTKDGDEKTEAVEKQDVPSLEELVSKAKAEGANWSIDQWKEASKSVLINVAPMLNAIKELSDKIEKNPDNVVSVLTEMEKKQKEFEGVEKLLNEFGTESVALAAYNAGPGRVRQWLKEYGTKEDGSILYIPYPETSKYVGRVQSARGVYERLYPELSNRDGEN